MGQNKHIDWAKWIFGLIVLFYIITYAGYGINDTDGGFIKAYWYRLTQGQIPYVDFIYVRPPWSIFQHYLEMYLVPEGYEIYAERVFFYLKMALINMMSAYVILRGSSQKYIWIILGFIVSVHNYPAASWHTLDGVFYAVLGVYSFLKIVDWQNDGDPKKFNFVALSISTFFIFLSMLSKQSFYPLLIIWPMFLIFYSDWKSALFGFFDLLFWGWIFYFTLSQYGILNVYQYWTSGATDVYQALDHGVLTYFRLNLIVSCTVVFFVASIFIKDKLWSRILMIAFISLLVVTYVLGVWKNQDFYIPESQIKILTLLATLYWLKMILRGNFSFIAKHKGLLFLFAVSGMVSLSWGLDIPLLFSLPILYSFGLWYQHFKFSTVYKWSFVLMLILAFGYASQFIYREGKRSNVTVAVSEVFSHVKGVYTTPKHLAKYKELKQLAEEMPVFDVLPSMPLAHYLTKTPTKLKLDWVISAETNGNNDLLLNQLKRKKYFIFVEKECLEEIYERKERNEVTLYVLSHYKKIKEGVYFDVYSK